MAQIGPARALRPDVVVDGITEDGQVVYRHGDDTLLTPVDEFDRMYGAVLTTTAVIEEEVG